MNYRKAIHRTKIINPILLAVLLLFSLPANAQDGTLKWVFNIGSPIRSSPAIGTDGTIYVSSHGGNLYAINADGTQKWVFQTNGDIYYSSPTIGKDGTIYVSFKNLYAINSDGTQKWVLSGCGWGSSAVGADGTTYIGCEDGLRAINEDGTQKWVAPDAGGNPFIGADGTIYSGLGATGLKATNPDGTDKWLFPAPGNNPIPTPGAIGADGTLYVTAYNANLHSITPDGTEKWATFVWAEERDVSPVIGADGTIYVSSGPLYAINPDGTQKWVSQAVGYSISPAIGVDGTIFVAAYWDGNLYAINADGAIKWAFEIGSPSSPAIGADGTIYVGGNDGLYAINSSSGGLSDTSWPMFMHDVRHTARFGALFTKFEDVPPGYWAEDAIYKIYEAGITKGCCQAPLKFCPTRTVNRDQMAVFLGRATHDSNFTPPDAVGIFADVPKWYWAADWIEQFYADGLTNGCKVDPHGLQSPTIYYCPKYPVTRTTMAIFLLRAKHGANYDPPPATGIFGDVWVNYWAADWIEQLYEEGITTGCQSNPLMYCPSIHVTRAQMAAFLARMLSL